MAGLMESLGLGGVFGETSGDRPLVRIPMDASVTFTADDLRRRCAEANLQGRMAERERCAKIAKGFFDATAQPVPNAAGIVIADQIRNGDR